MADRGILSSLRYLFADVIGDDDAPTPILPEGLPEVVVPVASDAIAMLIAYQGPSYAQLYVDRLKRFVGRRGFDDPDFAEVARLMAARMSYEDPIRIAQLTLAASETAPVPINEVKKFRIDELVGALPAIVAEPVLDTLEWLGWLRLPVSIRFSAASRWGIRRLKIEAGLKRWRMFSVRYPKEKAWVERWLHMISRGLDKQPSAVPAIVQSAAMIGGYGDPYRQGVADWNAIIDGLVKPTFDGVLALGNLGDAVTEARAAVLPDPRQAALKRKIAEIRAGVPNPA